MNENEKKIEGRVESAAERVLAERNVVSSIDVLVGLGWLNPMHVSDWKKGKIDFLERVVQVNLSKISLVMQCFRKWAAAKKLKPSETVYLVRTTGPKRHARFSKSGNENIEKAYRTHYVSPALSEKKQQALKQKQEKQPEIVVYKIYQESRCSRCQIEIHHDGFLVMEGNDPLCLKCAGLANLVFLPSGDTRITRQARQSSSRSAVVVQFIRSRKRYERQGLLVEAEALEKAHQVEKT